MFNTPRQGQAYGAPSAPFGASFTVDNPLASSVYDSDGLDPWSSAPSPVPPPLPSISSASAPSGFGAVIGDATVPPVYHQAFATVDTANIGETSVNGLSRVLGSSGLPASTIDRIVSLVSSRTRVSKLEFFVALALVALAQSGKDLSIERVAALAQDNILPIPTLDLSSLLPPASAYNSYQNTSEIRSPMPTRAYATEDPWNTAKVPTGTAPSLTPNGANGGTSSISGSGLPSNWWRKLETVHVNILGQQGFILNRYLVYEVATDRAPPVPRRYSEFVILWDCLVKRYPFRLLPALPPKRIGRKRSISASGETDTDSTTADEGFIEQRRRGLARFINFVVNHPVIKDDGLLAVFLTEPSFETWRKHSSISYDEESASKRIDRVEEMAIPSDLEDKLAVMRGKLSMLIEHWQKICLLAERLIKRREATAVRVPPTLARRTGTESHFAFHFGSILADDDAASNDSLASSIFSGLIHPNRAFIADPQADTARLTNTLKALVEVNDRCWRGEDCELCAGVRQGLSTVSQHTQRHADALEHRSRTLVYSTLEALKGQRDLYIATRDLFIRHDKLSGDQVDKLKKRVETSSLKLEAVKQAQKDGWEGEADKIAGTIEKDQASIAAALNRRVFIRACMWHELRVVLHNRENTLVTDAVRIFAREEHEFAESVATNWGSLSEALSDMPYE